MARITVEEVYRGEKYDVMSAAMAEYLSNGRPAEYDERTWVEMLIVKHGRGGEGTAYRQEPHRRHDHPEKQLRAQADTHRSTVGKVHKRGNAG